MFGRIPQPFQLASGGAGGGSSQPERVDHLKNVGVQIDGTFVATVAIEGRAAPLMAFQTLTTVTAGAIYAIPNDIPLFQLRITVSGYMSGTVSAMLAGRLSQA